MENIEGIFGKAMSIASDLKYKVIIDNELKEMSYMELGLFLTTNSRNIDKIEIITKG